jgi:hypothetical protein
MSPSPTGPGSWTLASTVAGRETSGARRRGSTALTKVSPSASMARALPQRSRRRTSKVSSERLLIETAEGTADADNILQKSRNQAKLAL